MISAKFLKDLLCLYESFITNRALLFHFGPWTLLKGPINSGRSTYPSLFVIRFSLDWLITFF